MWSNLIILHSTDAERDLQDFPALFSWRTCMRSLYIGDARLSAVSESTLYRAHVGWDAYRLLLEIVLGCRSRVFGETEVLHQFKQRFADSSIAGLGMESYLRQLRDQILNDAKRIRSAHLQNIGEQSYGGLANRLLGASPEIYLLGTGALAKHVLPWLARGGRRVVVVGRNRQKLNEYAAKDGVAATMSYEEFAAMPGAVKAAVIAAPITIRTYRDAFDQNACVVDFREEGAGDALPGDRYHSFESILVDLDRTAAKREAIRLRVDQAIDEVIQERESASLQLMHGWEDLSHFAGSAA